MEKREEETYKFLLLQIIRNRTMQSQLLHDLKVIQLFHQSLWFKESEMRRKLKEIHLLPEFRLLLVEARF